MTYEGETWIAMWEYGWLHDWRIRGTVISPHAQVSSRVFFGQTGGGTFSFSMRYPDDFPGAPALVPGEYEFRWTRVGKGAETAGVRVDHVTVDREALAGTDVSEILQPRRTLEEITRG